MIIWGSRWWADREALKGIPKTWIPVEKGDVNKKVRKMVVASLNRSAVIAWDARPRVPTEPPAIVSDSENQEVLAVPVPEAEVAGELQKQETEKSHHTVTIPPKKPVWGVISHDGWASPISSDLPNVQYSTVILELPHLIEAQAVSLAPADPSSDSEPPMPDVRAVSILQRPTSMGLRDYIGHLTSVGTITLPTIATEFLADYEYARFSGRPLNETQFRHLMSLFAELLRTMKGLASSILEELEMFDSESDIDGDVNSAATTPLTHRSRSLASKQSTISLSGTLKTAPSRRVMNNLTPTRGQTFSTAPATPATPKSRRPDFSRSPSSRSFAQIRHPYAGSTGSSQSSLRSTSQGSVIRLRSTNGSNDLPYTLMIPRTQS